MHFETEAWIMKRKPTQALALLSIVLFTAAVAFGQTATSSLANLPEADTLIYINPQRILNEALPKFLRRKILRACARVLKK